MYGIWTDWPTICWYSATETSGDDSKISSADLVPYGSQMSAATFDSESVVWVRSFSRLKTVLVYLAGISSVGYCRQSLSESSSGSSLESSVGPVGRVGRRSDRSEGKSAYRGQSVYPNSCPPTPESDVVLASVSTWAMASGERSGFSSRYAPTLATVPMNDPMSDVPLETQTTVSLGTRTAVG